MGGGGVNGYQLYQPRAAGRTPAMMFNSRPQSDVSLWRDDMFVLQLGRGNWREELSARETGEESLPRLRFDAGSSFLITSLL